MKLSEYLEKKRLAAADVPVARDGCPACRQPLPCCYCARIERFETPMTFAILTHPLEATKRIATGRMAHLCLADSHLIRGAVFAGDPRVDDLIADPAHHSVVLFPGEGSRELTAMTPEARRGLAPEGKRLLIFVIDGTWQTARKTMRLSENLGSLPRICFTPTEPSRFDVRLQPREDYLSTIEAIHRVIVLLGSEALARKAETMRRALAWMVRTELEYRRGERVGRLPDYRRRDPQD